MDILKIKHYTMKLLGLIIMGAIGLPIAFIFLLLLALIFYEAITDKDWEVVIPMSVTFIFLWGLFLFLTN